MTVLFVNGTLMRGLQLNGNLTGARFIGEGRTMPCYRIHTIGDVHPGMYRDDHVGSSVPGELYDVPDDLLKQIEEREPPGLYIGEVDLQGIGSVRGVLYPQPLAVDHPEITRFGGWRGYLAARDGRMASPFGSTGAWAWHHTGLAVRSLDAALDFHAGTLGFTVVFEARGMSDLISSVVGLPGLEADLAQCLSPVSGQTLEFIEFRQVPDDCPDLYPVRPGRAHTAFLVDDLDFALSSLIRAGGRAMGAITEFSEGRAVYCADGNGSVVELEEASCRATVDSTNWVPA